MVNTPCIDHGCNGFGLGYATAWVTVDSRRFTTTKHRAGPSVKEMVPV